MPDSSRSINELTGVKRPSSVLVRGFSAMEIAKQAGLIPGWYTEVEYSAWARGPAGPSDFDLWLALPGNAGKTLSDYHDFLGFTAGTQTAEVLALIADATAETEGDKIAAENAATAAAASAAAALVSQLAAEAAAAAAGDVDDFVLSSVIGASFRS